MNHTAHPWTDELRNQLDSLEAALLQGDNAQAIETASAEVQAVLQRAPKTAELARPDSLLREHMLQQAQRFGQLRQAVLRAHAQNQRAIKSLMPAHAAQPATYGKGVGSVTGGAGQAYLTA